jgi:hypothetical protein
MTPDRPSALRVLKKSLHFLSAGWAVSVGWLWVAQLQVNVSRFGAPPADYAVGTLIEGVFPAALVELLAVVLDRWMVTAPGFADPRREWVHAFWWTVVPNLLLLGTAYLMIAEAR